MPENISIFDFGFAISDLLQLCNEVAVSEWSNDIKEYYDDTCLMSSVFEKHRIFIFTKTVIHQPLTPWVSNTFGEDLGEAGHPPAGGWGQAPPRKRLGFIQSFHRSQQHHRFTQIWL